MSPTTRAGSSKSMAAIRINQDSILPLEWVPVPLVPEAMTVRGARRWLDAGMPDNSGNEYPGWR